MSQIPTAAKVAGAAAAGLLVAKMLSKADDISNRVVLVTGAAAGVGRLAALRFARQGCDVVLWDISDNGLLETEQAVRKAAPKRQCWRQKVDVGDRHAVYAAAEEIKRLIAPRHVSILVNNAGIVTGKLLLDSADERIISTFRVNTLAHFWTLKAFLPAMMQAKQGHVVAVASIAGLAAAPQMVDYAASKHAVVGLMEGMRREVYAVAGSQVVRFSTICPAHINTALFKGFNQPVFPPLEPEYVADLIVDSVRYRRTMVVAPSAGDPHLLKGLLSADTLDAVGRAAGTGSLSMMQQVDLKQADTHISQMGEVSAKL